MKKLDKWTIIHTTEGVKGTVHTLREARELCRLSEYDGRKQAGWKRIGGGLYRYTGPILLPGKESVYYIGTRQQLIQCRESFKHALLSYES